MVLLSFAGSPHGGVQKLLPEWNTQPRIKPVGLVKHTIVGSAAGAFAYFRDMTGVESTFILPKTGQIWQIMDTDRTADAQVAGNYWTVNGVAYGYLSVETEDNGDPEHDPWTQQQLDSITWLDNKLAGIYGWARQQTTAPAKITIPGGGSGHHSMWGINTATSKPNPWTTANGKTCPAAPRIAQQKTILLPRYIKGGSTPPEDDLSQADAMAALQDFFHAHDINVPSGQLNNDNFIVGLTTAAQTGFNAHNAIKSAIDALNADSDAQHAEIVAKLEEILAHLNPAPGP